MRTTQGLRIKTRITHNQPEKYQQQSKLETVFDLYTFKITVVQIEYFSIKCRKTKNQSYHNGQSECRKMPLFKSQWELKVKATKLRKARENASNQVVIGFTFASDWFEK